MCIQSSKTMCSILIVTETPLEHMIVSFFCYFVESAFARTTNNVLHDCLVIQKLVQQSQRIVTLFDLYIMQTAKCIHI